LMTESFTLSLASGLLGIGVAIVATKAAIVFSPSDIPRLDEASLDIGATSFAFLVVTLVTLLVGMAPAWKIARVDPAEALKSAGKGVSGGTRRVFRNAVVMV